MIYFEWYYNNTYSLTGDYIGRKAGTIKNVDLNAFHHTNSDGWYVYTSPPNCIMEPMRNDIAPTNYSLFWVDQIWLDLSKCKKSDLNEFINEYIDIFNKFILRELKLKRIINDLY